MISGFCRIGWLWLLVLWTFPIENVEAASSVEAAVEEASLSKGVSPGQVRVALKKGLWNPDKTAVAFTVPGKQGMFCAIVQKTPSGEWLLVDVSRVEAGNFGKLGTKRVKYERYETTPVKWLKRDDDNYYQCEFRTRAWQGGQRYTVSEPMLITKQGTPLYR